MKTLLAVSIVLIVICFALRARITTLAHMWRYGVEVEWSYGAASTVPTAIVFVKANGQRRECQYYFGGIEHPSLVMRDMDGDDVPDIIYGNGRQEIVVAFRPDERKLDQMFKLLKDNTGRGLNE